MVPLLHMNFLRRRAPAQAAVRPQRLAVLWRALQIVPAMQDFSPYWSRRQWMNMENMCEHCGCRGVEPIAELMDEHYELLDLGAEIRRHLDAGNRATAWTVLARLAHQLGHHVKREEAGIFRAMKDQGDFADAVMALEAEHADFDEAISELGLDDTELEARVNDLLDDLTLHIDKENLGIFPVAVVSLGASGWNTVEVAHERNSHAHAHDPARAIVAGLG